MTSDSSTKGLSRWYAVQCKGGESIRAAENLYRQGFEIFHPLIDHVSGKREPLFPYYLFIRLNRVDSNWQPIRSTRGVLRLVRFGMEPAAVPEEIINTLQQYASQRQADPINHYIKLKPALHNVSDTDDTHYLSLLDIRSGDERVIALMNLILAIKDPDAM